MATNKKIIGSLTIEAAYEGGGVASITLTPDEVLAAQSIIRRKCCANLYIMKKEGSSAMMFSDVGAATHALYRHGFDYMITAEAEKLNAGEGVLNG